MFRLPAVSLSVVSALLLLPIPAEASQTITGRVYDAATALPVAGATVRIRGLTAKTITDGEGHFALANVASGTWTVEVSKPPLESSGETIVVDKRRPPPPLDLLLIGKIEAVEVRQQARAETPVPGGTQLLRKEITRVPGARGDVLQAVQSLPGIANTGSFTPFSSGIVMRGSDPSDGRILVDGFEIPLLYHFGAVQSILPSEMIEDILYEPGGFGVEHGRASSGIIDVRTRRGQPKLGAFAELSFINAAAFVQGPIGKEANRATFSASLRRSIVDAILPAVLPDDSGLEFALLPRYYDWQGRVDWQPADRWRLSLFVFGTDDGARFAVDRVDPADPALSGRFGTTTRFGRAIASARYEADGFSNQLGLSLDYTRFSFEMSSDRHLRQSNEGITLRDEAQLRVSPRLTVRFGGESLTHLVERDEKMPQSQREGDPTQPNFTYDPMLERQASIVLPSLAAWVAADTRLGTATTLTTGLRYDGFLRSSSHVLAPRAELKMDLGQNTLRASGGLYARPPYWEDEVFQKSLAPERAWQAALGFERELRPGLSVQSTAFHTRRSNLITAMPMPAGQNAIPEKAYGNVGRGSTTGAELMLSSRGPKHFAWLAYTISRSTRQDGPGAPERLFDFDQTHNLVLVASRRFGKNEAWQVGGRFQLTTGKPYTPVLGSEPMAGAGGAPDRYRPILGELNSRRMETMHQLDLRLDHSWKFNDWALSAFVDVQNVYMHATVMDYRYSADYRDKRPITTLPILPSFGLRAEF